MATEKQYFYVDTEWDIARLQAGPDAEALRSIADETNTVFTYHRDKNAIEIEGVSAQEVQLARDELAKILCIGDEVSLKSNNWAKPDRPGLWGQRRDLKSKAPAEGEENDSDKDAEPPTLPSRWMLNAAAIPEVQVFMATGFPSDRPQIPQVTIAPRKLSLEQQQVRKEHVLPTHLGLRRRVFHLHAHEDCIKRSHPKQVEDIWPFHPRIIDNLTPCEERDMIMKLKEIAEETAVCLAYKKSAYGVQMTADSQLRIDDAINRLNAFARYLEDYVVFLPIPLTDLGPKPANEKSMQRPPGPRDDARSVVSVGPFSEDGEAVGPFSLPVVPVGKTPL